MAQCIESRCLDQTPTNISSIKIKTITALLASVLLAFMIIPGIAHADQLSSTDLEVSIPDTVIDEVPFGDFVPDSAEEYPPPEPNSAIIDDKPTDTLSTEAPSASNADQNQKLEDLSTQAIKENNISVIATTADETELEAFAIYSADDHSFNFYKRATVPSKGDIFEGKVVTDVYSGIETTPYKYNTKMPGWINSVGFQDRIHTVTFVDKIAPISMSAWFWKCTNLTAVNLIANLDTSNVTNMHALFSHCVSLTDLDVSSFNTHYVTHFGSTFLDCPKLKELDVSHFDTSSATNMDGMLSTGSPYITTLDISNFDVSNIPLSQWPISTNPNLETVYVPKSWHDEWFDNTNGRYNDCPKLTRFVCNFPIACAVYSADGSLTFHKRYDTAYDGWIVPASGSTFSYTYGTAKKIAVEKVYVGFEKVEYEDYNHVPWTNDGTAASIQTVAFVDSGISPIATNDWFCNFTNLNSIDLQRLDTSKVTNMANMFSGCFNLTSLDVSNFDTSSVENMYGMFYKCTSLTTLDLSNFNTINVWNMREMFNFCTSLVSLNLRYFDTRNVTDMHAMFHYDSALTVIYSGDWDYSKLEDSEGMFLNCTALIGEQGTRYIDHTYASGRGDFAQVDKGSNNPGFFTLAVDAEELTFTPIEAQTWSPSGSKPSPIVRDGNKLLIEGSHYTVTYNSNDTTGDGTVTITGIGKYMGSTTLTFKIVKADISSGDFSATTNGGPFTFTGLHLTPTVTLWQGSILPENIVSSENYDLSYENNLDAGTARITISGKRNLTGTKTIDFVIGQANIKDCVITFTDKGPFVFNGSAYTPKFVLELNGVEIDPKNYSSAYANNLNANDAPAKLTLTPRGSLAGSPLSKDFMIEFADLSDTTMTLSNYSYVYSGSSFKPQVTVKIGDYIVDPSDYDVHYSDQSDIGEVVVTIDYSAGSNFDRGENSASFQITKRDISSEKLIFMPDTYTYSGEAITPNFGLIADGRTLEEDTDYKTSYSADRTNVGTVTVTVKGTGNYCGQTLGTFSIIAADISTAKVTLSQSSYDFNGDAHEPNVTGLTLNGILIDKKNYAVTYENNVNAGQASVVITPVGKNLAGTKVEPFTINSISIANVLATDGAVKIDGLSIPANTSSTNMPEITFTGKEPSVVIKIGDAPLEKGKDYDLAFSPDNLNVGEHELTITGKTSSFKGQEKVTFYIAPANIESVEFGVVPPQIFTEEAVEPKISLTFNNIPLVENKDYTLSYQNNTNVTNEDNRAIIKVTGIGNFEGVSHDIEFVIARGLVYDADFFIESGVLVYNGKPQEPRFTLVENGKSLVAGTDFTYTYENNVNAGQGAVLIVGKNDYAGEVLHYFTILPLAIDGKGLAADGYTTIPAATISIDQANAVAKNSFVHYGKDITPSVTVSFNGSLLDPASYTLVYSDNSAPGAAMVTISGKGNYTGNVSAPFIIKKVPEMIEGHGQSWIPESTEHAVFRSDAPNIEFHNVKVDGVLLAEEEHFTRSEGSTVIKLKPEFLATLSPGTHTIDIESLAGTASGVFSIAEKQKNDDIVIQEPSQSTSAAASHKPNGSHSTSKPSYSTASWSNKKSIGVRADSATSETSLDDPDAIAIDEAMPSVNSEVFGDCGASSTKSDSSTSISPVWPWLLVAIGVAALVFLFIILARRKKKEESR